MAGLGGDEMVANLVGKWWVYRGATDDKSECWFDEFLRY
jgi:hypothetical protein